MAHDPESSVPYGMRGSINLSKRLTLLRHAKSGWDDPVARDFDRPLNDRGRRASVTIGRYAAAENLGVEAIIASPAVRVTETLDAFLPAADMDALEPHWDRRIYLASSATLLDLIREWDDEVDHILMSGHNPGMEDLILDLVPDSDGKDRDLVEDKYPTAALITMDLQVDHWRDASARCATILRFKRPRDLDPELGPEDD
jgi:phosphohistidine phosphatase